MSLKKLKVILAQVLIVLIMMPNLNVRAVDNDSNTTVEESNISETVDESINQQKLQDDAEEQDIVEDTISEVDEDNSETEVGIGEKIQKSAVVDSEVIEGSLVGEEYEAKKIVMPFVETSNEDLKERVEYKLKMEALEEVTVLEAKTDSEYEIALAHEDGSFTYVSSVESIEEAVKEVDSLNDDLEKDPEGTVDKLTNMSLKKSLFKFKNLNTSSSSGSTQATVINSSGQVVYSNNAMARIIKYINGSPYASGNINTTLYSDSALSKPSGYINHMFVEDAPILVDNGNSARILVAGESAWINKNTSSSQYDMVVVPLNQVKNPSYYIVLDGELRHFISSNITGTSGHTITLGKAPSYLIAGTRYFSYDGLYFYDGQNIQNGLNNLMNDYKSGSRARSVNSNNPFYLYYNYLPFRSKTVYTETELNRAIEANTQVTSKLRGIGSALKSAEQNYGVNALLALGVAINESGWGMSSISQSKNNLFGLNAVDSNPGQAADSYASPSASVNEFAKSYISRGYADPADWRYNGGFLGNKKNGANVRYASDPYWGEKAAQFAYRIDKHLSGTIDNLIDTNAYQIAMATSNNKVTFSDGNLLYNITNDKSQFSGYVETPFIITRKDKVTVVGQSTYEIYPERTTPVNNGGASNKFSGNYDWNIRGYINVNGVSLINTQKDIQPLVTVLGGATRFETAVELSKSIFGTADTVVLINRNAIIDGISATPLATALRAPILYTESNNLNSATKNEISRLKAKKVVIVGGEGIVTNNVVTEIRSMGITNIDRLGGATRYDTALKVAQYIDANCYDVSEIFLVNGAAEADAMSVGALGGQNKMPILLTEKNSIPINTFNWLAGEAITNAYVIGGTGVVSDSVLNRLNSIVKLDIRSKRVGGLNRQHTNALIIDRFYGKELAAVYAAKSHVLFDALAVGPVAALDKSPVVLVSNDINQLQKDVLSKRSTKKIVQAGLDLPQQGINSLRTVIKMYNL